MRIFAENMTLATAVRAFLPGFRTMSGAPKGWQRGDQSSVPYLRAALERAPRTDIVPCTWIHGRDALARLTRARTESDSENPLTQPRKPALRFIAR